MKSIEEFIDSIYDGFSAKQDSFLNLYRINDFDSWDYDQPSGVFTFSTQTEKQYFSFQIIGTLSQQSNTWKWAWSNQHLYPNLTTDSEKIRKFGLDKKYLKLNKQIWEADENDGWEMLAIANEVLRPLGFYRIPTEGLYMYIIFNDKLDEDEAQNRIKNSKQYVKCGEHGLRRPAYVCQHLNKDSLIGFHEAFQTSKDMELLPDDDFQAWCNKCEKVRIRHNGWTDEAQEQAKIKLVCENCYFEMKNKNIGTTENSR